MQARLSRIIIFCADVEKLATFYRDCFGLPIVGNLDKNWTVLSAGQTEIAFHKMNNEYLTTSVEDFKIIDSNVKLVFEIAADLASFRQDLLSKKVDVDEIKEFPGYPPWCDGRDPEGNVFQLLQIA